MNHFMLNCMKYLPLYSWKQLMKIFMKFSNKPQWLVYNITTVCFSLQKEFIVIQANIVIRRYYINAHALYHYASKILKKALSFWFLSLWYIYCYNYACLGNGRLVNKNVAYEIDVTKLQCSLFFLCKQSGGGGGGSLIFLFIYFF